MKWHESLWQRAWQRLLAVPALGVLIQAVRNYVLHQSANQAGSLAFSAVLAMFPLLILLSATAGYVGKSGDAAALASRVMSYAPQLVRDAMQPVIQQVLAQRNQALLDAGILATLWSASSGTRGRCMMPGAPCLLVKIAVPPHRPLSTGSGGNPVIR
jgi:membrane protein